METRPIDANALVASLQVSYKELRELCDSMKEGDGGKEVFQGWLVTLCEAILRTKGMPTLDYEPVRHGEWVEEIERNVVTASGRDVHLWRCSACGFSWANKHEVMSHYKHCPNCGAKMGKGDA